MTDSGFRDVQILNLRFAMYPKQHESTIRLSVMPNGQLIFFSHCLQLSKHGKYAIASLDQSTYVQGCPCMSDAAKDFKMDRLLGEAEMCSLTRPMHVNP